jgi:hypothetical protein
MLDPSASVNVLINDARSILELNAMKEYIAAHEDKL